MTETTTPAQASDEPMRANIELVIARLERIAGNFTDDPRNAAEEALVCARAALKAQPAPTEAQGDHITDVGEMVEVQGEDSARLDFFAPVVLDPSCCCAKCNPRAVGRMMILCATCGNKRCPHATDHALACTNSNEPGQVGSAYGPAAPQPQEQSCPKLS